MVCIDTRTGEIVRVACHNVMTIYELRNAAKSEGFEPCYGLDPEDAVKFRTVYID